MYKYINTTIAVIIIIIIIFHVYINFAYWMGCKMQINNLENEVYIINRKIHIMNRPQCPLLNKCPLFNKDPFMNRYRCSVYGQCPYYKQMVDNKSL